MAIKDHKDAYINDFTMSYVQAVNVVVSVNVMGIIETVMRSIISYSNVNYCEDLEVHFSISSVAASILIPVVGEIKLINLDDLVESVHEIIQADYVKLLYHKIEVKSICFVVEIKLKLEVVYRFKDILHIRVIVVGC